MNANNCVIESFGPYTIIIHPLQTKENLKKEKLRTLGLEQSRTFTCHLLMGCVK